MISFIFLPNYERENEKVYINILVCRYESLIVYFKQNLIKFAVFDYSPVKIKQETRVY